MKINIVTETEAQRWILRPWAEALGSALKFHVGVGWARVTGTADPNADVNIFCNYALFTKVDTITMSIFTHRERDARGARFDAIAEASDWCFAQCANTAKLLPSKKTSILSTGPTDRAYYGRELSIGVVGRDYPSGRKRMAWIPSIKAIEGVTVKTTGGRVSGDAMPKWYDSIDYLVVLSDNEGGPQPVMEAIGRGVPVIAPDVGYCWDYPVLRYTTIGELMEIIQTLVLPPNIWKWASAEVMYAIRQCK